MVFEQFLEKDSIRKHSLFIFLLGFSYAIISFFIANYFFNSNVSIVLLFIITLLLLPSMYVIINLEEKVESKEGLHNFYNNHKDIFKVMFFLFLGIFIGYIVLGFFTEYDTTFSYQKDFLSSRNTLSKNVIDDFKISNYSPNINKVIGVVSSNLYVILAAFLLSVFYGAGALFLITLNSSVFSAFIIFLMKNVNNYISVLGVFMIHMLPEITGFTLTAISGSIVSRALVSEKFNQYLRLKINFS